jgi:hypothetical protein
MFTAILVIAALSSSTAFTPSAVTSRSSTLKMSFDVTKQPGAVAPLGYFDPLCLTKYSDEADFKKWRDSELKHGRIAMMAVLGHIVTTAGVRLPGLETVPAGLGAFFGPNSVGGGRFAEVFLTIGLLEMGFTIRQDEIEKVHLEKSKWSEKTIATKKTIEINNGRAAMMGIFGLITHELIDGNPYVLNSLLGAPVAFNQ